MGLADALSTAMSGLRATQASLSLVSSNVANADTAGYVAKTADQVAVNSGQGTSVQVVGVNRTLNDFILSQLRTETSGASYASQMSTVLQQLQTYFGTPNSTSNLENAYSSLTTAVQTLDTTPNDTSAQLGVVTAAQTLAGQINSLSNNIQTLRGNAENDLSTTVSTANNLLQQISTINGQIQANPNGGTSTDTATASLLDQRDQAITQLSQLMDIKVVTSSSNQVQIYTGSGVQLVGGQAASLSFNAQSNVTPSTTWNSNPTQSQLGSVLVSYGDGSTVDLTSTLRSGQMAADIQLRDKTLVQAQTQLDQFAAKLSSALSDTTTAGTATTSGTQAGFTLNLSALQSGNSINITSTNNGTAQTFTIVGVSSASALPLSSSVTSNYTGTVIGVDLSGASGTIASQLNTALNSANLQFSSSGSTLTVLNNPPFSTVNSASVTTTATSLTSGSAALPLFTDGGSSYTGAIGAAGQEVTGYAQRITVNSAVVSNPSAVQVYATGPTTAAGDTTRPDFLLSQLTTAKFSFSPTTGIGSTGSPYTGTLSSYMQAFVGQQGSQAQSASQLAEGQQTVLSTLEQKNSAASGVNMDDEMAHLLDLQNAYSANARVMTTANQMYQILLQAMG